jgi:hypothetical protein
MSPEEEHNYQEAVRRIKEAEENKSTELDLSSLESLARFPPGLASLTSLQTLKLFCRQLRGDLSPLSELTSLQMLNLFGCRSPAVKQTFPWFHGWSLMKPSGMWRARKRTMLTPSASEKTRQEPNADRLRPF